MNLGEFRHKIRHYKDDTELVVSSIRGRHDIDIYGVIDYTIIDTKKHYCLIMPEENKMTLKEFLIYVKDLFIDWFENNVDERKRDNICFWINPLGGLSKLDINLRSMVGLPVWHRVLWYNFNLILFKIGGKFKLLNKNMQKYYDLMEEYNKK